jgi:hypothetical protein
VNRCRACHAKAELNLCTDCTKSVESMIQELPWLLAQLETTITRQDKLTTTNIGKSSETPLPLNITASDIAHETHTEIQKIVQRVENSLDRYWPMCTTPADFIGPLPPAWRRLPTNYTPTTLEYVDWLMRRTNTIARHRRAGSIYHALANLVGDGPRGGRLVDAINRTDRAYYGPCLTTIGRHRDGTPRQCGRILYAPRETIEITCQDCGVTVNAKKQRDDALATRDLFTEPLLREQLDIIGEHVSRPRIWDWIRSDRLQPRGYLHAGRIVERRVRRGDPRVFSLTQARELRKLDQKAGMINDEVARPPRWQKGAT